MDIALDHLKGDFVNRQHPDASSFLLTSYSRTDLNPASGAELVLTAQPRFTAGAAEL